MERERETETLSTWAELKEELIGRYMSNNSVWMAREKLHNLILIKEDDDRLFNFMKILHN